MGDEQDNGGQVLSAGERPITVVAIDDDVVILRTIARTLASAGLTCLTATTGGALFCGCATDGDCGSATSGRVCDATTRRCVAGCSASPTRNHCPAGQFCTSSDATGATVGTCTTTCNFDSY